MSQPIKKNFPKFSAFFWILSGFVLRVGGKKRNDKEERKTNKEKSQSKTIRMKERRKKKIKEKRRITEARAFRVPGFRCLIDASNESG